MKKIAVLTHEYYPYRGGVGRYCYNLFRHFDSDNYTVITDQEQSDSKVPTERIHLTSPLLRPRWLSGLFKMLLYPRFRHYSVVFTPHILPLGIIAYFIRALLRTPYVISLHGLDISAALIKKPILTRAILKNAACIIANSNYTASLVSKLNLQSRIEIITPSTDIRSEVSMQQQGELPLVLKKASNKKIILTVARIVRRKGIDMTVRALPAVLARVPNAYYIIIGNGPDAPYIRSIITETGLADYVTILSNVSDDDLTSYYRSAAVFSMPVRSIGPDAEGFGITYLEAASFRLPILAGRSGGAQEAVGERGAAFAQGDDPGDIAGKLIQLLTDATFARTCAENAARHLHTLPSWKTQSMRLHSILERAADAKPAVTIHYKHHR